ncbi:hypothetical protein DCAR_0414883 [Daucus carota subsp. sativus]|uniref:Uncharacterized protein n=1 Tax=Daucus carota subsp. sativus TaxID=79200 RepID=A0A161WM03_DAUCS|nr:hypothetical protein DCAR_0414883 [Daucus carota subsp. sativus]
MSDRRIPAEELVDAIIVRWNGQQKEEKYDRKKVDITTLNSDECNAGPLRSGGLRLLPFIKPCCESS